MIGTNPKRLLATTLKRVDEEDEISGDQTGSVEYYYQVPEKIQLDINTLSVQIKCALDKSDGFGSGVELPSGLKLDIQDKDGNTLLDLAKGRQIKNNDDLLLIVDGNVANGSKEYFGTRYYKANYSTPIKLRNQMKIVLTVDDDFGPHLTKMYFYITGILSDPV